MHPPASGAKNGVSTGDLLVPADKAKVTAKKCGPKEEKAPPERKPFVFEVVPFSQIKEHLCLVPSFLPACPMWVSHQTCVASPSFHTQKTAYESGQQLLAMDISQWVAFMWKTTSTSSSSRYLSYSAWSTPFVSQSAKSTLLAFICSISHASTYCGYCKSSLEATSTREHREKNPTATTGSLFIDCLFPLVLCAQNWYSPHFSCSKHKETSHTSSPECCPWAVSLSCPHNLLISLHRAISYTFLWGSQVPQLTRQKLILHNLRKPKNSPLADSGWNSALSFFLCFGGFFSPHCAAAQARTRSNSFYQECCNNHNTMSLQGSNLAPT